MSRSPSTRPTPKPARRAVLYARVASRQHPDDAPSSQRQLEACRRWAEQHGLTVSQEFADIGFAGLNADRPALRQLFDYIGTHPVAYVICEQMTTLARHYSLSISAVLRIENHGARVAVAAPDMVLDIHSHHLPTSMLGECKKEHA